jgi:hypothetical protein
MDSSSLSLSLAGKDKASMDSSSLSLFLLQERIKPARISLSFLLSQEKTAKKLFPLLKGKS